MRKTSSRSGPDADCAAAPARERHDAASGRSSNSPSSKSLVQAIGAWRAAAKSLARLQQIHYFKSAQFRTCLWPCVGRWASGQEAGQPPKDEISKTGSRVPCSCDRQPEAKPAHPALKRGTRLKATTERAFLGSPARMPEDLKRLVLLAGRAERDLPIRTKAAIEAAPRAPHSAVVANIAGGSPGGAPPCRIGEQCRDDSTHP
jgi:hypothetical protein